jgi:hypothetical protein
VAEIRYKAGPAKVHLARAGKVAARGEWCEVPDEYAAELADNPNWEVKDSKPAAKPAKKATGSNGDAPGA